MEFSVCIISDYTTNLEKRKGFKFPAKQDEKWVTLDSATYLGTINKYDILIFDLHTIDFNDVHLYLSKIDFYKFLEKPRVIICISSKNETYQNVSKYSWIPGISDLVIKKGKTTYLSITKEGDKYRALFHKYQWTWDCVFDVVSSLTTQYITIAKNFKDQSVALKARIGNGVVFIIPKPEFKTKITNQLIEKYIILFRDIIDICKNEIKELSISNRPEPEWVEKHVAIDEIQLKQQINELSEKYRVLIEAHKLFYEMSKELTRTVSFILRQMGFTTNIRENEGVQDIEICEEECNFVIEVTSSEDDWINIVKTRQLADWCSRFEKERGNKPKGILIANPYSNYPPPERDESFTAGALKHAENESFCLLTTIQLYDIYHDYINGKLNKEKITHILLSINGKLTYG